MIKRQIGLCLHLSVFFLLQGALRRRDAARCRGVLRPAGLPGGHLRRPRRRRDRQRERAPGAVEGQLPAVVIERPGLGGVWQEQAVPTAAHSLQGLSSVHARHVVADQSCWSLKAGHTHFFDLRASGAAALRGVSRGGRARHVQGVRFRPPGLHLCGTSLPVSAASRVC